MKKTLLVVLSSFVVIGLALPALGRLEAQSFTAQMLESAIQEGNVTDADLGVNTPKVLPGNPFYLLKEAGRGIQQFFTFGSVKKSELKLKFVDEKLVEAKTLLEKAPQNEAALKTAITTYNKQVGDLKNRLESLKETSQNANVDKLLEKVIDRAIKHEKLFDELLQKSEAVSAEAFGILEPGKGKFLDLISVVPQKFEDSVRFGERLQGIIEKQEGGAFESIRLLEMVDRLEARLPEEAKTQMAPIREGLLNQAKVAIGETSV